MAKDEYSQERHTIVVPSEQALPLLLSLQGLTVADRSRLGDFVTANKAHVKKYAEYLAEFYGNHLIDDFQQAVNIGLFNVAQKITEAETDSEELVQEWQGSIDQEIDEVLRENLGAETSPSRDNFSPRGEYRAEVQVISLEALRDAVEDSNIEIPRSLISEGITDPSKELLDSVFAAIRQKGRKHTERDLNILIKFYQGDSLTEIGELHGISPKRVEDVKNTMTALAGYLLFQNPSEPVSVEPAIIEGSHPPQRQRGARSPLPPRPDVRKPNRRG